MLKKKANIFYITGLPRSRTFWFSRYFSNMVGVNCLHQGLNGFKNISQLNERLMSYTVNHSGDSDSLLGFVNTDEYPTVIVERPLEEVLASLRANTDCRLDRTQIEIYRRLNKNLNKKKGYRVPYNKINFEIEGIHNYLGIPYDTRHADAFFKAKESLFKLEPLEAVTYNSIIRARCHTN